MKSQNQIAIESCAIGDVVNVNGSSYTVLSKGDVHGLTGLMIEVQDSSGSIKMISWYNEKRIGGTIFSLEEESEDRIKEIKIVKNTN